MEVSRSRWWVAAAALLALGPAALLWRHLNHPHMLHAGDRLTPLSLLSIDGRNYTLTPAGRPQVIHIFATWCTPCRVEMPLFAAAAPKMQKAGFDVVGIDQEESGARVAGFARDFDIKYPLYIDDSGVTHTVLGARFIPTTIFVGADGRIRWIHPGPMTERELTNFTSQEKQAG